MKKVYVGMSGGVDSSLTAALLVEAGYDVVGVYMKNWTVNLPGRHCPWAEDLADAKRVAVQLGIDFKVFDFENEYKNKVVDYMINEYKLGRTPNPDIMCNQEVKFKLFLDLSMNDGADMIATGHYANVTHNKNGGFLLKAEDQNKDQTYFLYRITKEALNRTLFPIGQYIKPDVRKMAQDRKLFTFDKKDSQGICFIGEVGINDFIGQYVDCVPGDIIDKNSCKKIGTHNGAILYTLGQRHGLDVGGGLPYYVVGKDMIKNEVYVTTNIDDNSLWSKSVHLEQTHWINAIPKVGNIYDVRLRHRAKLVKAKMVYRDDNDTCDIELIDSQRAIMPGQSAVLYEENICLGGGIVI
jgi:tRNA-specific 2-thiouridylase